MPTKDRSNEIFAHPARVLTVSEVEALTAIAKGRHALDDTALADYPPFFFRAEISSDRMDAYYTRMHSTSLINYAQDAERGISLQNSHRHNELGFGRSLTGLYTPGENEQTVTADFYTVKGLQLNGVNTDQLIAGIRTGLVKDVSIGFFGGEFRCSVCGRDLWDWDCSHVPGLSYAISDDHGDPGEPVTAFAWVRDAHLAEVSAVFDGATPGAAILKSQQEAEAGRLNPRQVQLLENRYRIALPGKSRQFTGANFQEDSMTVQKKTEQPEVITLPATEETPPVDERHLTLDRVEKALATVDGANVEARLAGVLAERTSLGQRVKALEAEVATLKPKAADGATYRADLIANALAEGVRAYGEKFDETTYRSLLESADLTVVKRLLTDWQSIGNGRLPSGRKTGDKHEAGAPETESTIPTAAYRA